MGLCRTRILVLIVAIGITQARSGAADPFDPPKPEAINKAIDRGVAWLKVRQLEDGSWGPCIGPTYGSAVDDREPCHAIGPTAFSVFTLAVCNLTDEDPAVQGGLRWLRAKARRGRDHTGKPTDYLYTSYESAAVILMLTALYGPRPADKPSRPLRYHRRKPPRGHFRKDEWDWMRERIEHLVDCQTDKGGFGYFAGSDAGPALPDGYHDLSITQFALLALRAATRVGFPVTGSYPRVWEAAWGCLKDEQHSNGGFGYRGTYPWSAGMTAASVASLLICREQIALARRELPVGIEERIRRGFAFLDESFDVARNRSGSGDGQRERHLNGWYHYCHLYAIERVGVLGGRRELGGRDWYLRGAAFLLRMQRKDGGWNDATCMIPQDVLGSCFALLFLKRATPPTVTLG